MSERDAVAAVVLAAGASTRLGQPKQLAPIGGRPALAYTLDALRASRVDRIVLVLGHTADAIAAALDLTDITVVRNDAYAEFFQDFSLGGALDLLATIDISRWKSPETLTRLHRALLKQNTALIGDNYRNCELRVAIDGRGRRAHDAPSIRERMRA